METSAKTSMNVNEIFMAIGGFQLFSQFFSGVLLIIFFIIIWESLYYRLIYVIKMNIEKYRSNLSANTLIDR